ncbi:MAG: prenyltransferase/squalene oxidase repeat-containing protein [Pirellulales bacterium]
MLSRGAVVAASLFLARSTEAFHFGADRSNEGLMDERAIAAVEKGLKYLASRQQPSGAFAAERLGGNIAVCGLAGMALMAAGSTPDRGPYGREVTRFHDYILGAATESGLIDVPRARSHGRMYDHGFATLFLAEVYGMSPRGDLRSKLAKAVQLIIDTQNDEGGWRYEPQRGEADISVTVCEVMTLRAARNAGIYVPGETIDRATDYVKRCQNPDGGFAYMASGGESGFARTAAAIVALYSAGLYDTAEVKKARAYLAAFRPRSDAVVRSNYYLYGHYYAAQAMWHAGGSAWAEWYTAVRDDLLTRQRSDGSWDDAYGAEYGTSMATLVLHMPNNYLPIFQR